MKKLLILLSMVILVGACTNVQPQGPVLVTNVAEVSEKEYELENLFTGEGLTLGFDKEGRIFGYSGLNRYFGKVEIDGGNIKVLALASTKMGGTREALVREDQYLSLLHSVTKIQEEKGKLILSNDRLEQLIFKVR